MAVPNTMIYFTLYDQLKVKYGFVEGQQNVWSPMFAGEVHWDRQSLCRPLQGFEHRYS